jgi:hypothetical protein
MPDTNKKKEIERLQFERLCRATPDLGLRLVEQPDPPAPDIVAAFAGRRIGIEVTTYYSGNEGTRREAEEAKIIELAKLQYEALSLPTVRVTVDWVINGSRSKSDRIALARAVADVVSRNIPDAGKWLELEWESLSEQLRESVNYIKISRLGDNCWLPVRAGWIMEFDVAKVQSVIDGKNGMLAGYRHHCNEVWLLIGRDSGSPSSWAELTSNCTTATYRSGFNRIFLLSEFGVKVAELSIQD